MLKPTQNCSRRVLAITAPSRLHFGLVSFGAGHEVQFGGVGLMIDRPSTRLRFAKAGELVLSVNEADRVRKAVEKWLLFRSRELGDSQFLLEQMPLEIRQISAPPTHVGLGTGTQLALAVAAGLDRWFGVTTPLTSASAAVLGRARRSAVGSHGFFVGGLIIDHGKRADDEIGGLQHRFELPAEWRLVLVAPRGQQGPFGHRENQLFRDLPAVDPRVASTLRLLLQNRLVPAARDANFEQLSAAIYEFGFLAGTCYERFQDGPFHSPTVQRAVELIRSLGITGVGQSSWGPCVFALCQSAADAASLLESLRNTLGNADFWFEISPINNRGYSVSECVDQPSTMEEPG